MDVNLNIQVKFDFSSGQMFFLTELKNRYWEIRSFRSLTLEVMHM